MRNLFQNNLTANLAADVTAVSTTFTVTAGQGARFGEFLAQDDFVVATITAPLRIPEIIRITARVGDALTVARGQEGTTAQMWGTDATIEGRITAAMLAGFAQTNMRDVRLGAGSITASEAVVLGANAQGEGFSVVVGVDSRSTSWGGVAIGAMAQVSGWDTTAVGQEAESLAGATCIGHYSGALGEESIVLGSYARAFERNSIAIGNGAVSYRGSALTISAVPCIGMDVRGSVASSDGSTRADKATTTVAQLFTHPVELAAGVPWTPSTVLTHGGIIRPPTPNGFYYIVSRDTFQLRPPLTFTITTGLNEPGWPTPAGQFNWMVEGMIVAINGTTAEIFVPPGMTFFPDEFGFICTDYSAVSAPPSVSIGTRENPTLFVNNQSMTGITGPNTRHRFGNINAGVEQWVRFTISLRAASTDTGTMQGRFYMSGTALERKGA